MALFKRDKPTEEETEKFEHFDRNELHTASVANLDVENPEDSTYYTEFQIKLKDDAVMNYPLFIASVAQAMNLQAEQASEWWLKSVEPDNLSKGEIKIMILRDALNYAIDDLFSNND